MSNLPANSNNEFYDIDFPEAQRRHLQKLNHTHEQMLNWLLLNPDKSLREMADFFGYTQAWVSSIIHSDIFKAALKDRQIQVAALVGASIPEKLRRAADIGVEKLTAQIEKSENPDFILDATDKLLHRLGYAPQSARAPGGMVNGQGAARTEINITVADLEAAQAIIASSARAQTQTLLEGEAQRVEDNSGEERE